MTVRVGPATRDEIDEPLRLLRDESAGGEGLSAGFVAGLREMIDAGGLEVLVARQEDDTLGVAVVAYRPSISAGASFASVEELYVKPGARRLGVGRALLKTVEERCVARGVSYLEVQAVDEEAEAFYAAVGFGREEVVVMSRSHALRSS